MRTVGIAVLAAAWALVAVEGAHAGGSFRLTGAVYDPASGPVAPCEAPAPGTGGSGSVKYQDPNGGYEQRWSWTIPTEITDGAKASTKVEAESKNANGISASMVLRPPLPLAEGSSGQEVDASHPPGQAGTATGTGSYTFSLKRDVVAGEKAYLRIGTGCINYVYEYTGVAAAPAPPPPAAAPPATAPALPAIQPATVAPKLGVETAYAAPAPGKAAETPLPDETGGAALTGEIRFVDDAGNPVQGPTLAAIAARYEDAFYVCFKISVNIVDADPEEYVVPFAPTIRCIQAVARILARADAIRARKGAPANAAQAGRCRVLTPRRSRKVKANLTCTRTATGIRVRLTTKKGGRSLRRVLGPKPRLVVARSRFATAGSGVRTVVRWTAR
jgi:hypothetical protein